MDNARPSVCLSQGKVVGIALHEPGFQATVDAFLGIPYALPPVGARRFRPAVKVAAAPDTVIDASRYGPIAPGRALLVSGPKLPQSEDCLTANVFRQAGPGAGQDHADTRRLPVAVYVHGGAFNRGSASMHDTASLVSWSAAPMVAVSFNYRLGSLGFLPSRLAKDEGVLNLGLRDQVLLFEWVQENIACFGGDPQNVTLIGMSAGAHSIGHHLLNVHEGVAPLFHRVVMESGAPTSRAVRPFDADVHEQQFRDYLAAAGVPRGLSSADTFARLRALPLATIVAAQDSVFAKYNASLRWAFQPVVDGDIIQQPPLDAWRSGRWHKVPILTGFNGNEGAIYVDKSMSASAQFADFFRTLLPQLTDSDIRAIETLYPDPATDPSSPYVEDRVGLGLGAQFKRIEAAYGQYAYVAPVRQTAEMAIASTPAPPVYVYHWALVTDKVNGAAHGDNMAYETYCQRITSRSEAQKTLSGYLHAYITSFITTGSPNGVAGPYAARPEWAPYGTGNKVTMVFGKGNEELIGGGVGTPAALVEDAWGAEQCQFWWSKTNISQL